MALEVRTCGSRGRFKTVPCDLKDQQEQQVSRINKGEELRKRQLKYNFATLLSYPNRNQTPLEENKECVPVALVWKWVEPRASTLALLILQLLLEPTVVLIYFPLFG